MVESSLINKEDERLFEEVKRLEIQMFLITNEYLKVQEKICIFFFFFFFYWNR